MDDLTNRFNYHAPDAAKAELHGNTRDQCLALAKALDEALPPSREKSLAITNLEQVMFWANAAIARN